jgi:micrococcal nuclease
MPIRGYYRVRTGKNSGVVISSGSGSGKGCGRVIYWVTIGWVVWLYKWLFIGLWKASKWLFQTALILIHKLSVYIENRLSDQGHYWGLKKVKAGVTASLLVLLIGGCWVTNALGQGRSNQATLLPPTTIPMNTIVPFTETPIIPTTAPTTTSTAVIPTTMNPTITLPASAGASCVPASSERQTAKVIRITDGDTIVVEIDGQEFHLRYIGVDSPENGSAGYSEATELNRSLVDGKTVTLVKDSSEVDRYDRLLRYVFVGDIFVNNEMVRTGYASSGSWPPDTSCDSQFAKTFQTAKANMVGLWVPTKTAKPYIPPTPTLNSNKSGIVEGGGSSTEEPAIISNNCDPAYPDVCIPPAPPDLDCKDIPYRRFRVLPPDPHRFDGNHDGVGCEG